jgi:hypothetical protein
LTWPFGGLIIEIVKTEGKMHIVMTSSAKMPNSVKAAYVNVAVVQINQHYTAQGLRPKMISERARGVLRVIRLGHYPAAGKTERSGYQQALKRADELAFRLNNVRDVAEGALLITGACA